VPSAIAAVAVGFVLGFWGDKFLPGFFYNTLPLPVVAGVVAAALYGLAAALWPPPQAAVSAAAAGSQSPAAQ
jgi:small basic protein